MWEEAIRLLNNLKPIVNQRDQLDWQMDRNNIISNAKLCLDKIGISMDDIDKLNIIHVSGTKGKGSTCAFSESILRHKGYKTGFFSSPHLVDPTERIRLNGKPLRREMFADYFMQCYSALDQTEVPMPNYFRFLTVMSFTLFVREKVDVAIIEVGLGGQYDCTNLIRKPTVCGVSSLGIDHVSILGDTLASIAWNKAGIFKPGVPAVTVPQKQEGMEVIIERALEIGIPLYISNILPIPLSALGIPGQIQVLNASLALQLTAIWLKTHSKEPPQQAVLSDLSTLPLECPPLTLTPDLRLGLSKCFWPGRCQTIKSPGVTFYLDGAHTIESMKEACSWLQTQSTKEAEAFKGRVVKVLMFTLTGERHPYSLIKEIMSLNLKYDYALFSTTIKSLILDTCKNDKDARIPHEEKIRRSIRNKLVWQECLKTQQSNGYTQTDSCKGDICNGLSKLDISPPLPPVVLPSFPIHQSKASAECISFVMPSIHDCLVWVSNNKDPRFSYSQSEAAQAGFEIPFDNSDLPSDLLIQVTCMGSFYLVGGVLSFIDPTLGY